MSHIHDTKADVLTFVVPINNERLRHCQVFEDRLLQFTISKPPHSE